MQQRDDEGRKLSCCHRCRTPDEEMGKLLVLIIVQPGDTIASVSGSVGWQAAAV